LDGPVVLEHAQEYITFQYMIVDFVHWSIDQWYIPDISIKNKSLKKIKNRGG
jgi:hypothetical protein